MNLSDRVKLIIAQELEKGGRSSSSASLRGAIAHSIYKELSLKRIPAMVIVPKNLSQYIRNEVIKYRLKIEKDKKKVIATSVVPNRGILRVVSVTPPIGLVLGTKTNISFSHKYDTFLGGTYEYNQIGTSYFVEGSFSGHIRKMKSTEYGGGLFARHSENIFNVEDSLDLTPERLVAADTPAFFYNESHYGYVDNATRVYYETSKTALTEEGQPDPTFTMDISSVLDTDQLVGKAIAYGKFRILLSYWSVRTRPEDSTRTTAITAIELIIIDTELFTAQRIAVPRTSWLAFTNAHTNMIFGYLDVQISLKTGKLLILKSSNDVTVVNMPVKYYDKVSDGEGGWNYILNSTSNMPVPAVPHSIVEYDIDEATGALIELGVHYQNSGIVEDFFGLGSSVYGGYYQIQFAQQPISNKLFTASSILAFTQPSDWDAFHAANPSISEPLVFGCSVQEVFSATTPGITPTTYGYDGGTMWTSTARTSGYADGPAFIYRDWLDNLLFYKYFYPAAYPLDSNGYGNVVLLYSSNIDYAGFMYSSKLSHVVSGSPIETDYPVDIVSTTPGQFMVILDQVTGQSHYAWRRHMYNRTITAQGETHGRNTAHLFIPGNGGNYLPIEAFIGGIEFWGPLGYGASLDRHRDGVVNVGAVQNEPNAATFFANNYNTDTKNDGSDRVVFYERHVYRLSVTNNMLYVAKVSEDMSSMGLVSLHKF